MNHSEVLSLIQEQSQILIGTALLELVGISPDNKRLNSPTSHTALLRGNFGLAAKIHLEPHVNLHLLDHFKEETDRTARQLDGTEATIPICNAPIPCILRVNPIIATGLTHWDREFHPFVLIPFVDGESLREIGVSNPESEASINKLCRNTTLSLTWTKRTSGVHILPSNVRFVSETQELVITKIWGNFSRYSSF